MTTLVIFDDQQDRSPIKDEIEKATGFTVHFECLEGKVPRDVVDDALKNFDPPNLVFFDHVLDKANQESTIRKGASLAPWIREAWPGIPFFAVTAAYDDCRKEQSSHVYEAIFRWEQFSELVKWLPSVIEGYEKLEAIGSIEEFVDLLNPSDHIRSTLISSIPEKLIQTVESKDFKNHAFRWIYKTLQTRPGYLLDLPWVAVELGVKLKNVKEFLASVEDARYQGIFENTDAPRWWRDRIYSRCFKDEIDPTTSIQNAACQVLKIEDGKRGVCASCKELWPEALGFSDESQTEVKDLVPLHLRCSRVHPNTRTIPNYEPVRVMLED